MENGDVIRICFSVDANRQCTRRWQRRIGVPASVEEAMYVNAQAFDNLVIKRSSRVAVTYHSHDGYTAGETSQYLESLPTA